MQYEAKKAFKICFLCVTTYIVNYYIRHILSVLTPSILSEGIYSKAYLALLSSTYMIVYAFGQLINGFIGDRVKPKYMLLAGLFLSSVSLTVFPFIGDKYYVGILCFIIMGIGLSMMRGPLVKAISENTLPKYARIGCVLLSFAGFSGPLLAGIASMLLKWRGVFIFSGIFALVVGLTSFCLLSVFEKKGIIVQRQTKEKYKTKKFPLLNLFSLRNFVPYMFIGMVIEISVASINFWIPTYLTQYLGFSQASSSLIFSIIAVGRSVCPFLSLFVFKIFKERDMLIVRTAFLVSTAIFVLVFLVKQPVLNVVLFTVALMCSGVASSTMWSIYIPSLADSGMVSSANGVLDCSGYIGASLMNYAVVPIMNNFGLGGVIISWGMTVLFGAVITLFAKDSKKAGI